MLSEFDKITKKGLARQVLTPPAYATESVDGWRTWAYAVRDTIEEITMQRAEYDEPESTITITLSDDIATPITDGWDGNLDSDFNINIT